jgi:uncharacterized integral membrane protein
MSGIFDQLGADINKLLAGAGIDQHTLIIILVAFIAGGLFLGGGHHRRMYNYGRRYYRRWRGYE